MSEDEKKNLYNRLVRQTSLELLLERMRLHGFWPKGAPLPEDPPEEAMERKEIERELESLRETFVAVQDPEKALAAERERRWEESKKRRAERKAEREAARLERKKRWEEERGGKLVHLGEGTSAGLSREEARSDEERLRELGLPVIHNGAKLAAALEIDLQTLKWLTYHRRGAALVHYHRYEIPKKAGGTRRISAPKPMLLRAQRWVLENILEKIENAPDAHGFIRGRSIVTNASPHVGKIVVINFDVKDFFPSFGFRRVKGLFHKRLGYAEHVATALALLCTEPPRLEVRFDERRLWVALGERFVPQGAPTSPAITNLLSSRLDRRLAGAARTRDFVYTRYADDLTFSGNDVEAVGGLMALVRRVIRSEGLEPNEAKTRVMRRASRQEVTGVNVNEKLGLARDEMRRLRAILHNCERHGLESQNRRDHPNFAAWLGGKVAYVQMVAPEKGRELRASLKRVLAKEA